MSRSIPGAPGRRSTRRTGTARPVLIASTFAIGADLCGRGSPLEAVQRHPDPAAAAELDGMTAPSVADVEATRAEINGRLKPPAPSTAVSTKDAVPRDGAAAPTAASASPATESSADRSLRELLQERLGLLDEYDKAAREFKAASHPEPSPEKQADEARAELARLQSLLNQAASNPDVLLPPTFRGAAAGPKPVVSLEMKEAIEAATGECQESRAKLEALRAEAASREAQQNARRAERDRLFQTVVPQTAPSERDEAAGGPWNATTAANRDAAAAGEGATGQRVVESRGSRSMRLRAAEAEIALEAKLAGVRELGLQVAQAQAQYAEQTLGPDAIAVQRGRRASGARPQGPRRRRGERGEPRR